MHYHSANVGYYVGTIYSGRPHFGFCWPGCYEATLQKKPARLESSNHLFFPLSESGLMKEPGEWPAATTASTDDPTLDTASAPPTTGKARAQSYNWKFGHKVIEDHKYAATRDKDAFDSKLRAVSRLLPRSSQDACIWPCV